MPFTIQCPRCHKTGLVRRETVIKAGESVRHFQCGGCAFSWNELDVTMDADRRRAPERRRSGRTERRRQL